MTRVLPLVLLSGCWPLIPGQWSDYDAPAEAGITGEFWTRRYLGDYWQNSQDSAGVWLQFIDPPVAAPRWPIGFVPPGECVPFADLTIPDDPAAYVPPEVESVTLRSGSRALELPLIQGDGSFSRNLGAADYVPGEAWTLEPVGGDPLWSSDRIAIAPGTGLAVAAPAVDGAELASVPKAGFEMRWERGGDYEIVVVVAPFDASFEPVGAQIACNPGDEEAMTIAVSDSAAAGAILTTWGGAGRARARVVE